MVTATNNNWWFKEGKYAIVSQSDSLWSTVWEKSTSLLYDIQTLCLITPNGKKKTNGDFFPPRSWGCSPLPEPFLDLGGWHTLHLHCPFCRGSSPFSQLCGNCCQQPPVWRSGWVMEIQIMVNLHDKALWQSYSRHRTIQNVGQNWQPLHSSQVSLNTCTKCEHLWTLNDLICSK